MAAFGVRCGAGSVSHEDQDPTLQVNCPQSVSAAAPRVTRQLPMCKIIRGLLVAVLLGMLALPAQEFKCCAD